MEFWLVQILNGTTMGMLLFMLAAGFTVIFGLMGIVNLAHGSFYMLGAYVGITLARSTDSFLAGVVTGACIIGLIGVVMRRGLLQYYAKEPLAQVLLTIGLLFILADAALWIWGGDPYLLKKPAGFEGSVGIGAISFPTYRFLVIIVGLIMAILLWLFQERTKYGAIIRAGVDDEEMTRGIGINSPLVMTLVFGLGALLGGLGGVIGGPIMGSYPGLDLDVLVLAMAVVIIGGKGSLVGAFVGALFVGLADTFGKVLFPEFNYFLIFGFMAVILAVKPTGLFGRE